jgi:hypothetical protein
MDGIPAAAAACGPAAAAAERQHIETCICAQSRCSGYGYPFGRYSTPSDALAKRHSSADERVVTGVLQTYDTPTNNKVHRNERGYIQRRNT